MDPSPKYLKIELLMFPNQLIFGTRELENIMCLTANTWVIYLLRFYPIPAWRYFLPELM